MLDKPQIPRIPISNEKVCRCGQHYYGQGYDLCPDCYEKEETIQKRIQAHVKRESTSQTLEEKFKARLLADEYFGDYFSQFPELDKLVARFCRLAIFTGKNPMLEFEKMDFWISKNKPKKKWEQFIANWLGKEDKW